MTDLGNDLGGEDAVGITNDAATDIAPRGNSIYNAPSIALYISLWL